MKNREAEIERAKFYVGGDLQWRDSELEKRRNQGRPWVTVNKCKPAVDQIEGDIRLNPPGPQCHPVGAAADGDTADIIEGLIRECEYRSHARTAYSTAGRDSAATGYGVIELATEFCDERSFSQRLVILPVNDPSAVFFDPVARMANRQDAGWAGKIRMYSKSEYIGQFGKNRRALQGKWTQSAAGWLQDALGIDGTLAQINEWTGNGEGPFYVCEFYMVEIKPAKLRLYTDLIARYDDEEVPSGVKPKDGDEYVRAVPRRTIVKYIVDAFEVLDETDWPGTLIPLFPILGPEIYIEGKLHRLSLISGAMDSQRALNYVATTATEIAGLMPKSPWVGWKGQFQDPRWQTADSEVWAYLEIEPAFAVSPVSGAETLLPAPQRNSWEAPIQWLVMLWQQFSDSIKATTAIYDPSLGKQEGDQSGKAIEQLRSESSTGNFSYADNLHRGIEVMYGEMLIIFPKIMDGPRVVVVVKPNSQHETAEINRDFPEDGLDPATGKKGVSNNITLGQYSVRVIAGPSFETRQEQAIQALLDFFKMAPQAIAMPGVAAAFLRMIGEGNPQVEGMADLISPPPGAEANPQQLGQQLQAAQQQVQALSAVVQKLGLEKLSKDNEIAAKKWTAAVNALAGIREAEIKAGVDQAGMDAASLEHLTGLAHETAMQGAEHEHATKIADKQAATQSMLSAQNAAQQPEPEPAGVE